MRKKISSFIKSFFQKKIIKKISIKIGIVDDHDLFRKGLSNMIVSCGHTVLFECFNGFDLIEKINQNNLPDVVLVDVDMPEMDGFETTSWLKKNYPTVNVLAMGIDDDENTTIRLLMNGAKGYIPKYIDPQDLDSAFKTIVRKGFYDYREMGQDLIRYT